MRPPLSARQNRGICENDLAGPARIQSENTEAPTARGPYSLSVSCGIGRNISFWKYLFLLFISGVTRGGSLGSRIRLAHSYIDWFRYQGGANIRFAVIV